MTESRTVRAAWAVSAVASLLLVVDLFLDWQKVTVDVAGTVLVNATNSGWNGWGFAVGAFAILLSAVAWSYAVRPRTVEDHLYAVGMLPAVLLVTTVLAVFGGGADVDVGQVVGVQVDTDLWPTWAGLGLGVIASAAAITAIFVDLGVARGRDTTTAIHAR